MYFTAKANCSNFAEFVLASRTLFELYSRERVRARKVATLDILLIIDTERSLIQLSSLQSYQRWRNIWSELGWALLGYIKYNVIHTALETYCICSRLYRARANPENWTSGETIIHRRSISLSVRDRGSVQLIGNILSRCTLTFNRNYGIVVIPRAISHVDSRYVNLSLSESGYRTQKWASSDGRYKKKSDGDRRRGVKDEDIAQTHGAYSIMSVQWARALHPQLGEVVEWPSSPVTLRLIRQSV